MAKETVPHSPTHVRTDEWPTYTSHVGTAEALLAAGLVQLRHLPGQPGMPPGPVFLHKGELAGRVRRLDYQDDPENWCRIKALDDGTYQLDVGIPRAENLSRRAANREHDAKRRAQWKAEAMERRNKSETEKKRSDAELTLKQMPRSKKAFLGEIAESLSTFVLFSIEGESSLRERKRFHGYMLTPQSVDAILLSFDAVMEAIMEAEVTFDPVLHQEVISRYQHEIATADDRFQRDLQRLVTPNAEALEGGSK